MRKVTMLSITMIFVTLAFGECPDGNGVTYRQIKADVYRDRMMAAWIGQMAGVGWGGPTEFNYNGIIIPKEKFPGWTPETINQYEQDDLYVEMTFLNSLEKYGMSLTARQAGIDFANSGYELWHANKFGRKNLRNGIAPPDSGHPKFNAHADDIDYQIEADFSGIIAPGLPVVVMKMGDIFGRLMNYGDGLYGGVFVGAMYSEAYFESSPEVIVKKALESIPSDSQYHECISDVLMWHQEYPGDWETSWKWINEKYQLDPGYRKGSCGDEGGFNIDAKINGAYIVMGLLYGQGDPDKTIEIATRCGQDSDCNPSNAAGVLFTTLGMSRLPEKFTSALKRDVKFSHTAYTFDGLIEVCEKLARQSVALGGGKVITDNEGKEVFCIPVVKPVPGSAERCWEPGPIANSVFTDAEKAMITAKEK